MFNFLIYALFMCELCYPVSLSNEALAIAACESGDTVNLGSHKWYAFNDNKDGSTDGGAFQINDYWIWNPDDRWMLRPIANSVGITSDEFVRNWPSPLAAPPSVQYVVFNYVWNEGYGWKHWSASKSCWSKWISVDSNGKAYFKK
jgi:hypothetical protein